MRAQRIPALVAIGVLLLSEACGVLTGVAFTLGGNHYHHPVLMGVVVGALVGLALGAFGWLMANA